MSLREDVEELVISFGVSRHPGLYRKWAEEEITKLELHMEKWVDKLPNIEVNPYTVVYEMIRYMRYGESEY